MASLSRLISFRFTTRFDTVLSWLPDILADCWMVFVVAWGKGRFMVAKESCRGKKEEGRFEGFSRPGRC